ncbi:MAG: alpha/beta hydrolase [Acidobacteria bacterium]|nr:alpha/beta hydrolase [Acidobacteriota bacterium]
MKVLSAAARFLKRLLRSEPEAVRTEHVLQGRLLLLRDVRSTFLDVARDIVIYLPPEYMDPGRRFPVLYMQDGQNLFDPRTSFIPGKDWQLGETLDRETRARRVAPLIVVAPYNAGVKRIDEYTPTRDGKTAAGGGAGHYGRFLVEELKPFVDSQYRTRPDAQSTGVGGSSLGGLLSIYLGLTRPGVFGRIAAMSPSVWWDGEAIVSIARGTRAPAGQKVWLDMGTQEGRGALAATQRLRDALVASGYGRSLRYTEIRGGLHDETAWGKRTHRMLRFLFPPTSS